MTILLTTHLMEEADSLCDHIAIMHLGKVAAIGTPEELKKSSGIEDATLDEVFIHYTGDTLDTGGGYRDAARTRRTARRLG
jgi:ABC-2 type transport system ATP-binding protein